jgi:hypothetical protein
MDKDDYLSSLDEASCFNFENYVSDIKWRTQSSLSHIPSKKDNFSTTNEKTNEARKNKIETNVIKNYE